MAALSATQDHDLISRSYDAQDPSAPDHTHPRSVTVPGVVTQPENQPARDDLDALFEDEAEFAQPPQGSATAAGQESAESLERIVADRLEARRLEAQDEQNALGLGIDEEIKVRKPRAPVAKLDHDRLLGEKGIPRLQRITKERLKFKGKGHEFSDVARLLNTYQLWLDDMFPKAKFADGLAIIEKLGHTKRMQVMRREWIEAGKPRPYAGSNHSDDDGDFGGPEGPGEGNEAPNVESRVQEAANDVPDEDDLYGDPSSLFIPETTSHNAQQQASERSRPPDDADMDELDQLLAAEETATEPSQPTQDKAGDDRFADRFADDMEAMAGMDWD